MTRCHGNVVGRGGEQVADETWRTRIDVAVGLDDALGDGAYPGEDAEARALMLDWRLWLDIVSSLIVFDYRRRGSVPFRNSARASQQ